MDGISIIASSAASLVSSCLTVYRNVSTFIHETKIVGDNIRVLQVEIEELRKVIAEIHHSLNNPTLADAALNPQTGYELNHWKNVKQSLDDCKKPLERVQSVLESVETAGGRILRQMRMQWALDAKSSEITMIKQELSLYRWTLQVSLQMI